MLISENASFKGTNSYIAAWDNYKNSQAYDSSLYALKMKGLVQPYLDNILRSAFDAGYNSKINIGNEKGRNSKKVD